MSEPANDEPYPYDDEEPECCHACLGEGYVHACGEDTCCCRYPERDFLYPCEECGGKGTL